MKHPNPARLWLGIYGVGFLVCLGLFLSSVLTPVAYGDLTRIGRISESAFGWREAPPPIPDANIKTWPIEEADVLVIGDSFSVRYAWQSPLVGAGYRVTTTHWDNTGPLCADFPEWVSRTGFKGKVVIVESIERLLEGRVQKSGSCTTMKPGFKPTAPPFENPSKPPPQGQFNWKAELLGVWLAWRNTREIQRVDAWTYDHERYGELIDARRAPDGCRQFSHVACDKILLTSEDRINPPLSPESATFMQRFTAQAAPYQVLWMVIPNKSTVYLKPEHADAFRAAFNPMKLGPDLFALAQDERFKVKDFFPANETHVSAAGYLLLGQRMLEAVRGVQPAPSAKSP